MSTTKKAKAVAVLPDVATAHTKANTRKLSTATIAQEERILDALRTGPQTTDDLRQIGCYQASARIWGLRHRRGFNIHTELFNGPAADGLHHARMARYVLLDATATEGGAHHGR